MKTTTIQRIFNSSEEFPFFHIEDAFVSGILAEKGRIKRLLTPDIRLDGTLKMEEHIWNLGNATLKAQLVNDKNLMYKIWMRQKSCRDP